MNITAASIPLRVTTYRLMTLSSQILLVASWCILQTSTLPKMVAAAEIQDATQNKQKRSTTKQKRKKARRNSPLTPITDNPKLPRVLLIGDSISIGYTLPVRKKLAGKVNVHRPTTNCGPTTKGLKSLDNWLRKGKWDVIHFNWGLHDLKYMGPNGENLGDPKSPTSHQQVPPKQYEANLTKLVQRLKKTRATLIWCHTTPVPVGAKGRVVGDSQAYNKIAARVMKQEGVAIHDLYGFCKPRLSEIQRKADVHFTPAGSEQLAAQVASVIQQALQQ